MKKIKKNCLKNIRKNILIHAHIANASHVGSCLSIVEILYTLYFHNLKKKDEFILSKGHAALALYCTLTERGILNKKQLNTFGKNNSLLMSHVSHKVKGVNFSTGSLGHGLPYAVGRALGEKINKTKIKIYVLISDGELNEGTTWESLLFASYHKLDNLIIIIDNNKIQSLDYSKNILKLEPIKKKLESFSCNVIKINGHNCIDFNIALKKIKKNKVNIVLADTIKGKGVSFMENNNLWHYKSPDKDQLKKALENL